MLDEKILQLPTKDLRMEAVKAAVQESLDAGTFTYTEVMILDEALMTLVFEFLDGVSVSSANIPQYGTETIHNVGPVRLVSIDGRPIKYRKWVQDRIPGTSKYSPKRKREVDLGTDAMVDDSKDSGRLARHLLGVSGWPIRNIRSRSGSVGTIVEWRWLEKAAAEPGDSGENREVRELYQRLKGNADAPIEAPQKTKNAPPAGAGART